jgi:EF hand
MRIRRAPGIASRVPISYDRDKQLREIFTNLDFGKTGVVLLSDLKAASDFVELRMEASRKLSGSKSLYEVFAAMDTDGNGHIDIDEFVFAMTGTRNSALEQLSEGDVEQIKFLYVEYGHLQKRKDALETLRKKSTRDQSRPNINSEAHGASELSVCSSEPSVISAPAGDKVAVKGAGATKDKGNRGGGVRTGTQKSPGAARKSVTVTAHSTGSAVKKLDPADLAVKSDLLKAALSSNNPNLDSVRYRSFHVLFEPKEMIRLHQSTKDKPVSMHMNDKKGLAESSSELGESSIHSHSHSHDKGADKATDSKSDTSAVALMKEKLAIVSAAHAQAVSMSSKSSHSHPGHGDSSGDMTKSHKRLTKAGLPKGLDESRSGSEKDTAQRKVISSMFTLSQHAASVSDGASSSVQSRLPRWYLKEKHIMQDLLGFKLTLRSQGEGEEGGDDDDDDFYNVVYDADIHRSLLVPKESKHDEHGNDEDDEDTNDKQEDKSQHQAKFEEMRTIGLTQLENFAVAAEEEKREAARKKAEAKEKEYQELERRLWKERRQKIIVSRSTQYSMSACRSMSRNEIYHRIRRVIHLRFVLTVSVSCRKCCLMVSCARGTAASVRRSSS